MNCSGIIIDPRETDYVKDVSSPIVFRSVAEQWKDNLCFFERQKFGWDNDGCVLFTAQESADAQMDAQSPSFPQPLADWLTANGYMDTGMDGKLHFHSSPRFIHILSGTGTNGTALQTPWDVMRKYGMLPWKDLPFDEAMSQNEYFASASVTQAMRGKAAEFLRIIGGKDAIQYHWVVNGLKQGTDVKAMLAALPQAPLCIGTAACEPWDQVEVPTCPSVSPEHSTLAYLMDGVTNVLDHYAPFLKQLNYSYNVPYAMQGIVTANYQAVPVPLPLPLPDSIQPTPQNLSILEKIASLMSQIVNLLKGRQNPGSTNPMSSKAKGALHLIVNLVGNGAIISLVPADYKAVAVVVFNMAQVLLAYLDPTYAVQLMAAAQKLPTAPEAVQ